MLTDVAVADVGNINLRNSTVLFPVGFAKLSILDFD